MNADRAVAPWLTGRIAGALLGVHAGDALGATLEFSFLGRHQGAVSGRPARDHRRRPVRAGRRATPPTTPISPGPSCWLTPSSRPARTSSGRRPTTCSAGWMATGRAAFQARLPRTSAAPPRRAWSATGARVIPAPRAPVPATRATARSCGACRPRWRCRAGQRRISESIEISAVTHDDERAVTACAAYNEIAAALIAGLPPDDSVTAGLATARDLGSAEVASAIEAGSRAEPRDARRRR